MAKTLYTYEINVNGSPLVTDIKTRETARKELAQCKEVGYNNAKIIQHVFKLETIKQVR